MTEGSRPGDTAGVIAPPPLIALATLVIAVIADWLMPIGVIKAVVNWPARIVIGALFFLAGGLVALMAVRTFRRVGTNVPPWQPTLALATTGIYRRLRNPMYVGVTAMLVGIALAFALDWLLILLVPVALILHFGVVRREERYLEAKFGDDYRRYKDQVPRYGWPR
jgi:protein-S-isoprenylcysteine O-methyltransferase Ste14